MLDPTGSLLCSSNNLLCVNCGGDNAQTDSQPSENIKKIRKIKNPFNSTSNGNSAKTKNTNYYSGGYISDVAVRGFGNIFLALETAILDITSRSDKMFKLSLESKEAASFISDSKMTDIIIKIGLWNAQGLVENAAELQVFRNMINHSFII